MRVVLDSNILVRATRSGSPARAVFELLAEPSHLLLASEFIFEELDRVLRYPRLRAVHGLDDAQIDQHVEDIKNAATAIVLPTTAATVVIADPQDDPIVATAVIGKANVLCTLDHHLRQPPVAAYLAQFQIRVMTDVELLAELRASQSDRG